MCKDVKVQLKGKRFAQISSRIANGSECTERELYKLEKVGKHSPWTDEEHEMFLDAVRQYGKDWKKITLALPQRTRAQIASHAQLWRKNCYKDPETPGVDLIYHFEGPRDSES